MACRRLWLGLITAAIPFCVLSIEGAADDKARATIGPQAVPPDHRELIARAILKKTELHKIRRAKVTRPSLSYGHGDPIRPVVCARLTIQDAQGQRELHTGFTFEHGQIDEVFNPDDAEPRVGQALAAVVKYGYRCSTLTYESFPELSKTTK